MRFIFAASLCSTTRAGTTPYHLRGAGAVLFGAKCVYGYPENFLGTRNDRSLLMQAQISKQTRSSVLFGSSVPGVARLSAARLDSGHLQSLQIENQHTHWQGRCNLLALSHRTSGRRAHRDETEAAESGRLMRLLGRFAKHAREPPHFHLSRHTSLAIH